MDSMNVLSIVLFISIALFQCSAGTSTGKLLKMCRKGCKAQQRNGMSRTSCREFTLACNSLLRQRQILSDIERAAGIKQFSTSTNTRGRKIANRKRKQRKVSDQDGIAAAVVGNGAAMASNDYSFIHTKGHKKPKVSYGNSMAFASDSQERVYSSDGKNGKKLKKSHKTDGTAAAAVGNGEAMASNYQGVIHAKGHKKPKVSTNRNAIAFASDGNKTVFSSDGKNKKKPKKSHKTDGMAVSVVGNGVGMASNDHTIIHAKGHKKPKVSTYGSGIAVASDGDETVFSSDGKYGKKPKKSHKVSSDDPASYFMDFLNTYEQKLKNDEYSKEDRSEESDSQESKYRTLKMNSSEEKENDSDEEHTTNNDYTTESTLEENIKKFHASVEAKNKQIMDQIMNDLKAQMG